MSEHRPAAARAAPDRPRPAEARLDGPDHRLRGAARHLVLSRRGQEPGSTWASRTRASGRPPTTTGSCPRTGSRSSSRASGSGCVKYRSFQVFMDICVRCGACADKCHFFIGSGDPKNMPVLRAELLRSVYRRDFTTAGKILGELAGGRELTAGGAQGVVLLLLPVHRVPALLGLLPVRHRHRRDHDDGPRAAEPGRPQHQLGRSSRSPTATAPATTSGSSRTPSRTTSSSWCDELADVTGIRVEPPINRKGAEVLFVMPVGRLLRRPRHLHLHGLPAAVPAHRPRLHAVGLRLGGRATSGSSPPTRRSSGSTTRSTHEAKRLGVKWIIGGECGHMWRVLHQYMDTMNGPADFLEVPRSPITGTVFDNAALDQDGPHLRVHRRPDPARQAQARPAAATTTAGDLPRLVQPGARDGPARGAALRHQERLQPLLRDAREHDPRADLLLRRRRRARQRREHGDAPARRPAARQRGALRPRPARRQHAGLHLRDRPGDPAAADASTGRRASTSAASTSWSATPWSWRARRNAPPTCGASRSTRAR